MNEINEFIETENKYVNYFLIFSGLIISIILYFGYMHFVTGYTIYLFINIILGLCVLFGFVLVALIRVQNKILLVLGSIIDGVGNKKDVEGVIDKLIPQFVKMIKKELK